MAKEEKQTNIEHKNEKKKRKSNKLFDRREFFRISLVTQVSFFFILGTIITGIISYFTLNYNTDQTNRKAKEDLSEQINSGLMMETARYPAYDWLLTYWRDNCKTLDVEYDTIFETVKKAEGLCLRHPGVVLKMVTPSEIEEFSFDDQKIYAEVIYNWLLQTFNDIKVTYHVDFVYLMITDPECKEDMFLFSGSDGTLKRSSNFGDAYTLGTTVQSTPDQAQSLKDAINNKNKIVESGTFMDQYLYAGDLSDGSHIFYGTTFDLSEHRMEVKFGTRRGAISFMVLQGVLSVICLCLIYFFTIRPVKRIQTNVREYKDDKDSNRTKEGLLKISSYNEIGELRDDIAEMVASIDTYMTEIREITAEKERIGAELNVAAKIQEEMLPNDFPAFPDRKEFNIYATMDPAKEVGGDFYDFFLIDEDHLGLVIADVSGKGVPASLFMVISKTLIKTRALMGGTPAEILYDVNNQLCERNEIGYFVTVWLAIVTISTGEGIAANAGHEHPALRKKDGSFEMIKYRHSPAVGTMEGMKFREHEFKLDPGDRVYVFTDGVPEATNAENELFGEERTLAALNKDPNASLEQLLQGVKSSIDEFVGEAVQFDDITMLGFDYFGEKVEDGQD